MPQNEADFLEIARALEAGGVRFVVVGGLAMVLHGSAHVTQDIDVAYSREADNLRALADAVAPLHPRLRGVPPGLPFVLDDRTLRNTVNLTLDTDRGDFDLLGHVAGIDSFDGLWTRSVAMPLGEGLTVRVAALDDLITMKKAANRLKDQGHVLELEALRRLRQADEDAGANP